MSDHGAWGKKKILSANVSPLLNLQKIITAVEGLGTWQPTQRDEPPSELIGSEVVTCHWGERGMIASLATTWKDRKKKDGWKDGDSPPTAAPVPSGLFGCHPHTVVLSSVIFLDFPSLFLIFAAASAARLVKHVRFPEQQLSLALMDLACLHPLAFLITLSRDLLSPTIKLMNLAI